MASRDHRRRTPEPSWTHKKKGTWRNGRHKNDLLNQKLERKDSWTPWDSSGWSTVRNGLSSGRRKYWTNSRRTIWNLDKYCDYLEKLNFGKLTRSIKYDKKEKERRLSCISFPSSPASFSTAYPPFRIINKGTFISHLITQFKIKFVNVHSFVSFLVSKQF